MTELLTAAQMRAIEQAAIDRGAVTGLELMERAGRGVVEAIFEAWPELEKAPHRAVVLCGPGNNGGDGFVIARLLKAWGWEVDVFLYGDPEKLPPDARANYQRWEAMGPVEDLLSGSSEQVDPASKSGDILLADIVIDALFGTGLTRSLPNLPLVREIMSVTSGNNVVSRRVENAPKVIAVDVPSGLCADSGQHLRTSPGMRDRDCFADLTVTFQWAKRGHFLASGPQACKKLAIVDIGLEGSLRPRLGASPPPGGAVGGGPAVPPGERVVEVGAPVPGYLSKDTTSHKYGYGHALILSGPMGRSGAARLAARGALRVGAGLVTVGAPGSAMMECATQLTAIMLRKCDGAEGLSGVLEDPRLNALCLGPGLGVGEGTRALTAAALAAERATLLDADALTSFAETPQALFDLLHPNTVLTPHGGEFARLFPDIAETLAAPATKGPAYSKVDATREAATRAGCTVLFKGPDTVVASPDGRCAINAAVYDRAAPWLATAGSGDVLAGIITGLLARGLSAQDAAEIGAWLHVEAARAFGPGLIAEDLPEMLPQVFRALEDT